MKNLERLREQRKIKLAKAILESNGYKVSKKLSEAGRRPGWKATKPAAKKSNPTQELINSIKSSNDPLDTAFEALVPISGKSDNVAGEMVRAMMRILYRDYNDGDLFYSGYGIETCGSAVSYLIEVLPNLKSKFESIAMREMRDNEYTKAIEGISNQVIQHILSNPELLTQRNEDDMHDYDYDWIKDEWEPKKDYEVEIPGELQAHIDARNISERELKSELAGWEMLRNAENISVYGYGITVEGVDPETYDELDHGLYDALVSYANDLDEEYGVPGEDEYEEEEDY